MSDLFTVDLEFRDGRQASQQFVTKQEALAYAGQMAMDSAIARSEACGFDVSPFLERDIRDAKKNIEELKAKLETSNRKEAIQAQLRSAQKHLNELEAQS